MPLLIESLKNRINDSLHAGHIDEYRHGPGAPRTSTKQCSMALVVRSLHHNGCGESKNVQLGPDGREFSRFADGVGLGRPISMRPLNMAPSSILMRAV